MLTKLKGRKFLLLGNHDSGKDQNLLQNFQKIEVWKAFPEFGLLLTHVPVHPSCLFKNDGTPVMNIHGHIHEKDSPEGRYRNVCVEKTNYTPINIEELRYKE
jgi:calcineurin-like phosphoesterase family protein